jgi:DNA invertase Pin-like site-specific DNA recombinase
MNTEGFVAYFRVSTLAQGKSGLGIEAQRTAVLHYASARGWKILKEFTEVESGRRHDRPALEGALAVSRAHRVPIVVAKVDRLTRSVSFLSRLLESGADVRFADLPTLEGPTGRFMLQQMAAVAELEAGLISARTKSALAAAKCRGVRLGGFKGVTPTPQHREMALRARQGVAMQRALDVGPILAEISASGVTTLSGVAEALSARRIPTPRGRATWTPTQVARLIERLGIAGTPALNEQREGKETRGS